MAWSFATLSAELDRVLDDAGGNEYEENLRVDGVNAALRTFVVHWPVQTLQQYEDVDEFDVPADCYSIVVIRSVDATSREIFLKKVRVSDMAATLAQQTSGSNYWWRWDDVIYLGDTMDDVNLYYEAYYPEVEADTADIPVPTWAREAIVYRAAAYCCNKLIATRSLSGTWADKRDAPPLQNSMIQAADFFRKEYERLIAEHFAAQREP